MGSQVKIAGYRLLRNRATRIRVYASFMSRRLIHRSLHFSHGCMTLHVRKATAQLTALVAVAGASLVGCSSDQPMNPTLPVTRAEARAAIRQMHHDQRSLQRPVIVLGGIHDPGFMPAHIADVIRDSGPAAERQRIMSIAFLETGSFDSCADKVIRTLESRFPSEDPARTIEVDVVGFSMGGLVARHAASDSYGGHQGKRLNIARLFTISSPHTGARLANLPTLDKRVKFMRHGSEFLQTLNQQQHPEAEYPLFAYVRLDDAVVGEQHAAPPGANPWWVASGLVFSHTFAGRDVRILADILRRLRYEEPLSTEPAAPLP